MDNKLIIAITREKGAGGVKIAHAVAKILDIPMFSKESFLVKTEGSERRTLMSNEEIKKAIVSKAPCVAVGRCAHYIMSDPNITYFSVFIKAPNKTRRTNLKSEYDLDSQTVEKVFENENDMKKHFEKHTGLKWGASKSYDLVLNTGKMKRDDAIATICEVALGLMNKRAVRSHD
ncbi:MAG: cytidylate kinase family protein [Eubacteriales bacterium]|nr:cytidylate kinase family protein [Eubacteriales bacterium]